jgi:hypothetical protein
MMHATAPAAGTEPIPATGETGAPRRPPWSLPVVVIAVVAVVIAFGFGVHGLLENPIVATDSAGISTLRGSFEPFPCAATAAGCAQGYVQAGARSVFVVFPRGCPNPYREQQITVRATRDNSLGSASYLASTCAQPG